MQTRAHIISKQPSREIKTKNKEVHRTNNVARWQCSHVLLFLIVCFVCSKRDFSDIFDLRPTPQLFSHLLPPANRGSSEQTYVTFLYSTCWYEIQCIEGRYIREANYFQVNTGKKKINKKNQRSLTWRYILSDVQYAVNIIVVGPEISLLVVSYKIVHLEASLLLNMPAASIQTSHIIALLNNSLQQLTVLKMHVCMCVCSCALRKDMITNTPPSTLQQIQ